MPTIPSSKRPRPPVSSANAESISFWNVHQVASFGEEVTAAESLHELGLRNALYPGLLDLMPVNFPGKEILDFGCGPGHDTIQFLLHGAKHVYAADVSEFGLASLQHRLRAHGLADRCTVILLGKVWGIPKDSVDHIHAAGVIHHLAYPVPALRKLARALRPEGEIRMMVYSAESQFFQQHCSRSKKVFRSRLDHGAPIINVWTAEEVTDLAAQAGLYATYVGSYRIPSETEGPGLSSCWSLRK